MKILKKTLSLSLGLMLLAIFSSISVFAGEGSPRFTVRFVGETAGRHVAEPGQSIEGRLEIRNIDASRSISLRNELRDSVNWEPIPHDWIELEPEIIRGLNPWERAYVSYSIDIPEDAELGTYRVSVLTTLFEYNNGNNPPIAVVVGSSNAIFLDIVAGAICDDQGVCVPYLYGDTNLDGDIDNVDVSCYQNMWFEDNTELECRLAPLEQLDFDCDGDIDIFDVDQAIYLNVNGTFWDDLDNDGDLIPACRESGQNVELGAEIVGEAPSNAPSSFTANPSLRWFEVAPIVPTSKKLKSLDQKKVQNLESMKTLKTPAKSSKFEKSSSWKVLR